MGENVRDSWEDNMVVLDNSNYSELFSELIRENRLICDKIGGKRQNKWHFSEFEAFERFPRGINPKSRILRYSFSGVLLLNILCLAVISGLC